jgi:hypothetical protein
MPVVTTITNVHASVSRIGMVESSWMPFTGAGYRLRN